MNAPYEFSKGACGIDDLLPILGALILCVIKPRSNSFVERENYNLCCDKIVIAVARTR